MIRPGDKIPDLLKNWDQVKERISSSRHAVVFLDFDGTLVSIAARPDQVRVAPAMRRILRRLVSQPRLTLAIISGRRRVEIQRYIQLRGIHYFGLYGWERGHQARFPTKARRELSRAWSAIAARLYPRADIWIENKGSSLSIHLLGASAKVQDRVRREIRAVLRPFHRSLRIFENLRDVEIVPKCVRGKGAAVRHFLANPTFRRALPIYFGDDFSDEPAFAAVERGISVLVAKARATKARFHLRGPGELVTALTKLEEALA
jgi:trehalose-phosphatase